jgi:hypothetical protein
LVRHTPVPGQEVNPTPFFPLFDGLIASAPLVPVLLTLKEVNLTLFLA